MYSNGHLPRCLEVQLMELKLSAGMYVVCSWYGKYENTEGEFVPDSITFDGQVRVNARCIITDAVVIWKGLVAGKWTVIHEGDTLDMTKFKAPVIAIYTVKLPSTDGITDGCLFNIRLIPKRVGNEMIVDKTLLASDIQWAVEDQFRHMFNAPEGKNKYDEWLVTAAGQSYTRLVRFHLTFMRNLQPVTVSKSGHITITQLARKYHMHCVHVLHLEEKSGTYIGYQLVHSEDIGEDEELELTKPSQLRVGIRGTLPISYLDAFDKTKAFKRFKLIASQEHRMMEIPKSLLEPAAVRVDKADRMPPGIVLISLKLANECQVLGDDGEFHPLQTGDKLAGVVRTKEFGDVLLKATVVVAPTPGYTMILSDDVMKGVCEFCEDTQLHIVSRAEERASVGPWIKLSYQLIQFFEGLGIVRAKNLLDEPRIVGWFGIPPEVSADEESEYYGMERAPIWGPTIRELIHGCAKPADYAQLFEYHRVDHNGNDILDMTRDGRLILENNSVVGHEEPIRAKVMLLLDGIFNPPGRGAWLVAVPNRWGKQGNYDSTVSLHVDHWKALGCPEYVAVTRYPIKGRSSVVRMRVLTHTDHYGAEISPSIMDMVFNGDFDGDLICIIAEEDIVELAWDPIESLDLARIAREAAKAVPERKLVQTYETYKEAAQELLRMDQMGRSTTVRDNAWSMGGLTELELLVLFETVVQPAINRKEGAMIANTLDFMRDVSRHTGIGMSYLTSDTGEANYGPNPALQVLRGRVGLVEALETARKSNKVGSGVHGRIVRVLRNLVLGI